MLNETVRCSVMAAQRRVARFLGVMPATMAPRVGMRLKRTVQCPFRMSRWRSM